MENPGRHQEQRPSVVGGGIFGSIVHDGTQLDFPIVRVHILLGGFCQVEKSGIVVELRELWSERSVRSVGRGGSHNWGGSGLARRGFPGACLALYFWAGISVSDRCVWHGKFLSFLFLPLLPCPGNATSSPRTRDRA